VLQQQQAGTCHIMASGLCNHLISRCGAQSECWVLNIWHLCRPSPQRSKAASSLGVRLRDGGTVAVSTSEPGPSATSVTIADSADMRRPR
jgi:hypothetical protein